MKRKIAWLILSCLMVTTLLMVSCAPAVPEEEEVITPPPEEEVVAPPPEEEEEMVTEEEVAPPEEESRCCEGYTIFCGAGPDVNATLVDMDGEVVNEWSIFSHPVKMLPGGSILGNKRTRQGKDNPLVPDAPSPGAPPEGAPPGGPPPGAPPGGPPPGAPPAGAPPAGAKAKGPPPWFDAIEFVQLSWDGEEEWSFCDWDDDGTGVMMSRQHHDYQREGNPVGYYAPGQEFVKQGKTLILAHIKKVVPEISDKVLLDDVIYEVDWDGNLTGFEWYPADHFEEYGFDESAKEQIYNNPHYDAIRGHGDWLHMNTLSVLGENHWYDETGDERFNPENIMISSRSANFIAIISRATGNIVWKAGPDFVEGTPEYKLGQFVGQHHPHMIPKGLPGAGNILVFDNGGTSGYGEPPVPLEEAKAKAKGPPPRYARGYSRVIEFNPVTFEIVWQYGAESGDEFFFSQNISSAQRLPNGNTLITEGANGRLFEVTPDKEIVWEFFSPAGPAGNPGPLYRAYRVPPEWVPGNPAGYTEWTTLYE